MFQKENEYQKSIRSSVDGVVLNFEPQPSNLTTRTMPSENTVYTLPERFFIARHVVGKGIGLGFWSPFDTSGEKLGKVFNLFAAPEDIEGNPKENVLLTFKGAAEQVARLRDWHGHDGGMIENETELYQALKDGSILGKWFIPPIEIVRGKDRAGNKVTSNNFFDLKNSGDFKGTFFKHQRDLGEFYWTCTENPSLPYEALFVALRDGACLWDNKYDTNLSCRPCRVEAVKKLVL